MLKITFTFFLLVILSGCVTTANGPVYRDFKAPVINGEQSLIYVIRTDSTPKLLGDRTVSIDGTKPKTLGDHGFLVFVRPAGKHRIEFGIPFGRRNIWRKYEPENVTIETEGGATYFIQFFTQIQDYGAVIDGNFGYRNMTYETEAHTLNKEEAEKVLTNHRLQE